MGSISICDFGLCFDFHDHSLHVSSVLLLTVVHQFVEFQKVHKKIEKTSSPSDHVLACQAKLNNSGWQQTFHFWFAQGNHNCEEQPTPAKFHKAPQQQERQHLKIRADAGVHVSFTICWRLTTMLIEISEASFHFSSR